MIWSVNSALLAAVNLPCGAFMKSCWITGYSSIRFLFWAESVERHDCLIFRTLAKTDGFGVAARGKFRRRVDSMPMVVITYLIQNLALTRHFTQGIGEVCDYWTY